MGWQMLVELYMNTFYIDEDDYFWEEDDTIGGIDMVTIMWNAVRNLNNKQFKQALDAAEEEIYSAAYLYAEGNQVLSARLLGVSRGTFINRMKKWELSL